MRQNDRLQIERVENAVLPMATAALETGQLETAKRLYGRLLELDPESFQARMGLGESALRDRQPAEAARWYGEAIEVGQVPAQRHEALLAHGRAALESGQWQAARESFTRLASPEEQAPQLSMAWGLNGIGLAWLLEDDLPRAVQFMEQATRQAPSEPAFQENLARARSMLAESGPFPDEDAPAPGTTFAIDPAPQAPEPEAPPVADSAPLEPAPAGNLPEPGLAEESAPAPAPETDQAQAEEISPAPETDPEAVAETPAAPEEERLPAPASEGPQPRDSRGFLMQEDGQQFVQMGAYRVRTSAVSLAAWLEEITNEPVSIVEGPSLYRVRIGPLASQSALAVLSDALDEAGFGRPRLPQSAKAEEPASAEASSKALVVTDEKGRFMQFGAFQSRAKAEALALRLQEEQLEAPVFIMETQLADGALLHRVRAGPIESDATYRALSSAAESLGFLIDQPSPDGADGVDGPAS